MKPMRIPVFEALVVAMISAGTASAQNLNLTISDSDTNTPPNVALSPCAIPLASATVNFEPDGDVNASVAVENMDDCLSGTAAGAPVVNLNLSATTIDSGDPVTVSWSVQNYINGVTVCTPSGGATTTWSSTTISAATGSAGPYTPTSGSTFTLSCVNGSDADNVALTVNGGGGGGGGFIPDPSLQCSTLHPPPTGTMRMTPFNFAVSGGAFQAGVSYEDVWGPWPGAANTRFVQIPANMYVSMPFITTTTPGDSMQITWVGQPGQSASSTFVTVTRCPGNFSTTDIVRECRQGSGTEGSQILAGVGDQNWCDLDPDTLYFLNVINASGSNPSVTACPTSSCLWVATP